MDWNRMNPFKASDSNVANQGNQQQQNRQQPGNQPGNQKVDPNDTMNRIQNPQNQQDVDGTNKADDGSSKGNGDEFDYSTLWENEVKLDSGGKPIQDVPASFLPTLTPEKQNEIFAKLNFTKGIKKEHLEAIKAGGDGSTEALMEILNTQGRDVAATMFRAISGITENAFKGAEERFLAKVPGSVNGVISANNLAKHPIMSKPEYAPMVENVRSQLQSKNPRATPDWIESATSKYFEKMFKGYSDIESDQNQKQQSQNQRKQNSGTDDFEQWFQDAT